MTAQDPRFVQKLLSQQTPGYLWIGCADSRVPAPRRAAASTHHSGRCVACFRTTPTTCQSVSSRVPQVTSR